MPSDGAPMAAPSFLWRVEVTVPEGARAAAEAVLEDACWAVTSFKGDGGAWRVAGYRDRAPDDAFRRRLAGAPVTVDRLPPTDWLKQSLEGFPPLRVGRFVVHGSHAPGPPPGRIAVMLDAGTAFGTGEHPSTAGCLMAIDALAKGRRFRRSLDMGCGSGILALAMAKAWRAPVVACDIDPDAVRAARRNARTNGVGGLVSVARGAGYGTPAVARGGPYDLIAANIFARPLAAMARGLDRRLAAGGVAVLSGLLQRDGAWVIARHRAFGLRVLRRIALGDWLTLVMARRRRKG